MQMQHVRVGRAPQVPVPPVSSRPLEISREMRQHMRMTRHRAFERHQENAEWTKELLSGDNMKGETLSTPIGRALTSMELHKRIEAKKQSSDELKRQLVQQKEAEQAAQRRQEEMLMALKTAGDAAALKECETKLEAEKKLLLSGNQRKMEIVRL